MKRWIHASNKQLSAQGVYNALDKPGYIYKIYVNGWEEGRNYACQMLSNSGVTYDDIDKLLDGKEITVGGDSFYVDYDLD